MFEYSDKFYNTFCKKAQSKNGMWEQRFFVDGRIAPCWGYQIDETASVIYGVYEHFKYTNNEKVLKENLKMCEKAIEFLIKYIKNLFNIEDEDLVKKEILLKINQRDETFKHVSYDIWEMNEGIHLYSLCAIYASFNAMNNIYDIIEHEYKSNRIKLEKIV